MSTSEERGPTVTVEQTTRTGETRWTLPPWAPVDRQIAAWFPSETHPYRLLQKAIDARVTPAAAVLDIGCGRTAPDLRRLKGAAGRLVGVDLVDFTIDDPALELIRVDARAMPQVDDETMDLAYSRAVMEHVEDVDGVFAEIRRVLKPGGDYVFLTPSKYDYASLVARVVPNGLHGRVVAFAEGRREEDVFPTYYRCNSRRAVSDVARRHGLEVTHFAYLGQYPAYLRFNRAAFWFGSLYEKLLEAIPPLAPLKGWILAVVTKR